MKWLLVRLIVLFVTLATVDVAGQVLPHLVEHVLGISKGGLASDLIDIACAVVLAVAMIAAYRLLVRATEGRWPSELGAHGSVGVTVLGVLIGIAMFSAVYAILWHLGFARLTGVDASSPVVIAAAAALGAAVGEEIVFRGVVYRVLEEGFGTLVAVIISSALFGFLHAFNRGATPISTAAIMLESGAMLGLAYAASRSLWLPIGIHFGWNFTEGGIFGAAVSGGKFHGAILGTLKGPDLWTGGAFGPEASLAAIGVGSALALVFGAIALASGNWQPMRLRWKAA